MHLRSDRGRQAEREIMVMNAGGCFCVSICVWLWVRAQTLSRTRTRASKRSEFLIDSLLKFVICRIVCVFKQYTYGVHSTITYVICIHEYKSHM